MATLKVSDNITPRIGKPLDSRYFEDSRIWASVEEVNSGITSNFRYTGLTVNVNDEEYWYKSGISDSDLILKEISNEIITASYTIYVETTGDDVTGNGTSDSPFASVRRALKSLAYKRISSSVIVTIKLGAGSFVWDTNEFEYFPTIYFVSSATIRIDGTYSVVASGFTTSVDADDPFLMTVSGIGTGFTENEHKFKFIGNANNPLYPISECSGTTIEATLGNTTYTKIYSLDTQVSFSDRYQLNISQNPDDFLLRFIHFDFPTYFNSTVKGVTLQACRIDHSGFIGGSVNGFENLSLNSCLVYYDGNGTYNSIFADNVLRSYFYDSGVKLADDPCIYEITNISSSIIENYKYAINIQRVSQIHSSRVAIKESDESIKIKNCDYVYYSSDNGVNNYSSTIKKLIVEDSPTLLKTNYVRNLQINVNELVGTLASIHDSGNPIKNLVEPSLNLTINIPGFYGEYDIIDDTTLTNSGVTYTVVGDTGQTRSIHLMYTLVRGSDYEEGVIRILYNGSNVFVLNDSQNSGSSPGVTFNADINGSEIRLVSTTTDTGNDATFKAQVKRVLI